MEQSYIANALISPLMKTMTSNQIETLTEHSQKISHIIKGMKNPNALIPLDDCDDLIHALSIIQNKPGLCVGLMENAHSTHLPPLQQLFLCCGTLREGLYYFERFSSVLCDALDIQINKTHEETIKITFSTHYISVTSSVRRRMELMLSTLLSWCKQLCGKDFSLVRATFPFPQPSYEKTYRRAYSDNISFSEQEFAIHIQPSWLDKRLHSTNPHILTMILQSVEEQYRKISRSCSLAERVRKAFKQAKIRLNANQQEVADYFHISARTLNRHLKKENTSLKQIVTQVRIEMAKALLINSTESIDKIAAKLALSGRRTLDRMFIKELNASPAQYRQTQRKTAELA